MNRKKRLAAWILAFVMIWVQLPTMQVMATIFDPQQYGDLVEEELKIGTVLKAGEDFIINTSTGATITVYYIDAEGNTLDAKPINKANGQQYTKYTVETVHSISNWEVNTINDSGSGVDEIALYQYISVDSIDINALSLPNEIRDGIGYQCYQLTAEVTPLDAKNKSVAWAVYDEHMQETDKAIISADPSTVGAKLLEVKEGGTYTVRALAEDGCGATDDQTLTVSIPVSGVTINSASSVVKGSTLNMSAGITPSNATNKNVTWSVTAGTGNASIDSNGMLSATAVGTVTVTATSVADPTVSATKEMTIEPQAVTGIVVNSANDATSVVNGNRLNMSATVTPDNAIDKNVIWSVTPGTGAATIDSSGVLTVTAVGTVTVKAISASNTDIFGTKVITITAPANNNNDNNSDSGGGGGSSPVAPASTAPAAEVNPVSAEAIKKTEEAISKLTETEKQDIAKEIKENLPYTLPEGGLTVEQLKALTKNKFTEAELQTIAKKPELLKALGIDTTALAATVALKPIENPEFKDVAPSHWAADTIKEATRLGIASGREDGNFAPSDPLQMADTFTFLDRVLLRHNITTSTLPRSTVEKYVTDKDHWAFNNMASIGSKLSRDTLKTISELGDKPLTRELLAQVLYEITRGKLKAVKEVPTFTDTQSSPYQEAINYCIAAGLLNGTSNNTMSPQKELTRAEMMTILIRLDKML